MGKLVCKPQCCSADEGDCLVEVQYDPELVYLTLATGRDLAFVTHLFNTWLCTNKKPKDYGAVQDIDAKGKSEARIFTLWLTALGVEPGVFDLFGNLEDGLIILQALHKILPDLVVWRRVSKPEGNPAGTPCGSLGGEAQEDVGITLNQSTLSSFKQVETTHDAVELGMQNRMRFGTRDSGRRYPSRRWDSDARAWSGAATHAFPRLPCMVLVQKAQRGWLDITETRMALQPFEKRNRPRAISNRLRTPQSPPASVLRRGIVDPAFVLHVQEGAYEERRQNGAPSFCFCLGLGCCQRVDDSQIGDFDR
ncbi:hypothetical protein V8E55_007138 [Tylopilus felleus]